MLPKKRILDLLPNFKKNGEKLDFSELNFSSPLRTKEATKKAGIRFF
jgi:aryl carrier-like protein